MEKDEKEGRVVLYSPGEKRKRQKEEKGSRKEGETHKKHKEEEIVSGPLEDLPSEMIQHIFSYVCADPQGVKAWAPLMGTAKWVQALLKDESFLDTQVFSFLSRKFLPLDGGDHSLNYKLKVFDLGKKVKRLKSLGDDRKLGEFYEEMLRANNNQYFLHPYLMAQIRPLASLSKRLFEARGEFLEARGEFYHSRPIRKVIKKVVSNLQTTLRTKRNEGKNSLHLEKALEKLEFFLSSRPLRSQKQLSFFKKEQYDCRVETIEEILRQDALMEGLVTYLGEVLYASLIDQLNETAYPVRLFRFMAAYLRIVDNVGAGKLLRYAADKGNKIDEYNYCDFCLEAGVNIEIYKDYLHKAAEKGHKRAQYELGMYYFNEGGVEKDDGKAFEWFAQAAAQAYAPAQYTLGLFYFNGRGVEKDDVKAFKWFAQAAAQGHTQAQYELGICYFNGNGVEKDEVTAFEWIQKAAAQGYAQAQYNLGACYFNGNGVEKDDRESLRWIQKAAAQGHAQAQYNLGACYFNGGSLEKDDMNAFEWVQKAAGQGHAQAQYNLGLFYFKGWGVEQNLEKAVAAVQPLPLETRQEGCKAVGLQEMDPFYEWVMSVPFKEASSEESREDSEKEKEV
jgi:TPR repeat protein